jgi:predicted dehydrogenase
MSENNTPEYHSMDRRKFMISSAAGVAAYALPDSAEARAPDDKKVVYGIVGAGNRGRNTHLRIANKYLPEVRVAAICDITKPNLDQALADAPGAKGYDDYRKMIETEKEIDAIIVAVPNFLHAEVTVAALNAGKHVLVEKPMAIHMADADRMMEAERRNHRVLQVGLQSRYGTVNEKMIQLLKDGAIGDLEYVVGNLYRGDWNPHSWKYKDPKTGVETNWRFLTYCAGSALLEDGIHELDVIHWVVGEEPSKVQAIGGNNVLKERQTIDNAGLLIDFSNGVRCVFSYTIYSPGSPDSRALRLLGSKGEMTWGIGTAEELRGTGNSEIVVIPYHGKAEKVVVPRLTAEEQASWREEAGGVSTDVESLREHKAFLASVVKGAPVFADGQVGKDAAHISLAAERSLRTGRVYPWSEESSI